ncbi:MAG: helix-turn-helix transcriptional regulator [bacterium]|uniref:Helix-turn-helix transcriptional regulator n=1 Tax=Candidatus Aphodosoma intestinipullorum TaxID=2840674 RepID=A0A940IFF2_9BACT|nr:helix-turn-helix transcriptional regulator [Candidatus Aphodosoma intestinipullorum]
MDELKYKIIDKAKELFLKYGLRSVTIDDICRDLRISKKTFYSVLKGKE